MREKGFSFFELLLVVGLMGILGALSSPFLSRFLSRNYLDDSKERLVKTLRKAQNYSLSGKQGSQWGVHYESGELVLFKGDSYGQDHLFDEEFKIPATVDISGWSDVTFSKMRGQPSTELTLTITGPTGLKTVILNQEGMVDAQ